MPLLGPCCFLPLIFAAFPDALSLLLPPPPAAFPFVLFRWLASFCLFCCPACLTLLFATPLPCRLLSFLVFLSGVWSGLPCFSGCFLSVLLLWRLCGTGWGARKQQSLRTWIVFPFCGSEVIWLAHSSGVVFFLDFLADPMVLLCCNALQVLCGDEDALGAPEQSCSYYTGFAPP